MKIKNNPKFKSLIPIEQFESSCLDQIRKQLEHDFLIKLTMMPDGHAGYTLPIGGVALLDSVISPEYVGYDQCCGMTFAETDLDVSDIYGYEQDIYDMIMNEIPVGFTSRSNKNRIHNELDFESASGDAKLTAKVSEVKDKQIATLGGGNHFIEIGVNQTDKICITIHSGSRRSGWEIASYYMKLSKTVDKHLPKGFFDLNSEFGQQFKTDLSWSLRYALVNRALMMKEILRIMSEYFNKELKINNLVNENHNNATIMHNGTVLHRKGATPAEKGQLGIIPGNMRDGVYITEGLGNEQYLSCASHGAGRRGSRKWAKETFDLDYLKETMKGIVGTVNESTIDESPEAYKDISEVIAAQEGVVINVVDYIKPLINIKG